MPADRLRLFFALWPDLAARARLTVIAATVARDRRGRATATGNLHVTLAFLGNVAPPLLPVIEGAGAAAAGQCPGFNVYFDRLGGRPGAISPGSPATRRTQASSPCIGNWPLPLTAGACPGKGRPSAPMSPWPDTAPGQRRASPQGPSPGR
jgi:hypothetical protein